MGTNTKSCFVLVVHGQIRTADFPELPSLWLRFSFVAGPDWNVVAGEPEGVSASCYRDHGRPFVLDVPFNVTYRSTNPFRWPQLVITCYGKDLFGNDVIRGYGALPIPTIPGRHELEVACSVPEPSTTFQKIVGYIWGRRAELVDANMVALSDGREVLRMRTNGMVRVAVDVLHKDMKRYGFDVSLSTLRTPATCPLPEFESLAIQPEPLATLAPVAPPPPRTTEHLMSTIVDAEREESGQSDDANWRPPVEPRPLPVPELVNDPDSL